MAKNGPDPRDNESYWNPTKQNSKESIKNGVDLNDAEKKATKTAKEMLDGESSDKKSNFKYSPNTSLKEVRLVWRCTYCDVCRNNIYSSTAFGAFADVREP